MIHTLNAGMTTTASPWIIPPVDYTHNGPQYKNAPKYHFNCLYLTYVVMHLTIQKLFTYVNRHASISAGVYTCQA